MTRVSLLATAAIAMLAAACAGQQSASTSASSISHGTERSHMSAQRQHRSTSPANESAATNPPAQTAEAAPSATPPAATTPATPAAPTTFTDAQLQSFITASQQIQPLNTQLASATPEQRTALAGQIRDILQQNNLDGATYNAIATQAQTDQALAARLAALQTPPTSG